MAVPDSLPELTISFERGDTPSPSCMQLADMLHGKFTAPHPRMKGKGLKEVGASILLLPDSYVQWWENVGYYTRRKVRRALRDGFSFERIDRTKYADDVHEINVSAPERQGKPMKDVYLKRPAYDPLPEYPCRRHQQLTYGVLRDGKLFAYTWVYQVGEMCLFSTILGHADHLQSGIMFQLIAGSLEDLIPTAGTRYAMYDMHFGGTDGLRYFKEQMGFQPYRVHWKRGDEPQKSRLGRLFARRD